MLFVLTLCISAVRVVLGELLQVVFQQHLISRDSLHWLQHVMLKCQTAADLLTLYRYKQKAQMIHSYQSVREKCPDSSLKEKENAANNHKISARSTMLPQPVCKSTIFKILS